MHEKDRKKLLAIGFTLFRCNERDLVVKKQFTAGQGWLIDSRYKTKKAVRERHLELLDDSGVIQI